MFIEVSTENYTDDVIINTEQIVSMHGGQMIKMSDGSTLNLTGDSYKELLLQVLPKPRKKKDYKPDKDLLALFNKLHQLTGGKGQVVFTLKREKQLKELLTKHRLTEADLIKAATNIGNDDFLQGDNDRHKRYGDIDYLLRPDKAAKWAEEQTKKEKGMF